ncbi:MAG: asparagine synthase (glutamine-hydrolyzing) [Candidatus Syntrophosphaera sp.]
MCGISGFYCLESDTKGDPGLLKEMTRLVSHRGPDDEGFFLWDPAKGGSHFSGRDSSDAVKKLYPPLDEGRSASLGFGFRRLAILDTGPGGHQPMSAPDLGLHIVFNGEIYNHIELREELKGAGYVFSSRSDTEVILKAYHAWGESCVNRFNGIWAFALWDERKRRLFCSRDRFGVKPFHYCSIAGIFHFASEIKQLLLTDVDKTLNEPMIWRSMKISSLQVYGAETFWKNIHTLEPGHNLVIEDGRQTLRRYHALDPAMMQKPAPTLEEAAESYRRAFLRAVELQMRSDVEVGSCLSGGLDSSAIVCSAAKLSARPLQTFSSYFAEEPALDERRWINEVCGQCGCVSRLTSPRPEDALAWFAEATWHNDLPLGSGFAAQYGVMKLAQESGIKVLLDGQGSDELTAGYRHAQYRFMAELLSRGNLKKAGGEIASFLKANPALFGIAGLGKTLLSLLLPESRLYELEFRHLRFEPFNRDFTQGCVRSLSEGILSRVADTPGGRLQNFLYNAVYTTSLPTLLHWEDRMSMANSIESRVPFLDHNLAELAFSLPAEYKIHRTLGKYVHRLGMKDIVPKAVYARQGKSVFGSPFHAQWMRGGLRDAFSGLFSSSGFRQRGIWDLPKIHRRWQKYLRGDGSQAEMLFNVFALETWFRRFT